MTAESLALDPRFQPDFNTSTARPNGQAMK
jgi:hypothetical protein